MGLNQSVLRYYARLPADDTWTLALSEGEKAPAYFKAAVYGMGLGEHSYKKLYLYDGYSRIVKARLTTKGSVYLEFANKDSVNFWWEIKSETDTNLTDLEDIFLRLIKN